MKGRLKFTGEQCDFRRRKTKTSSGEDKGGKVPYIFSPVFLAAKMDITKRNDRDERGKETSRKIGWCRYFEEHLDILQRSFLSLSNLFRSFLSTSSTVGGQ